jgi:hypothetical protein
VTLANTQAALQETGCKLDVRFARELFTFFDGIVYIGEWKKSAPWSIDMGLGRVPAGRDRSG